ncbi:MAG: hypothetical protein ACYC1D_10135 [Acidimicrobiales bacterium]
MTSPATARPPSRRRRTITGRAFGDLAVWMVGFGLGVGVVFPFAVIVIGVPARTSLRPAFFVATLTAGLMVGAANFLRIELAPETDGGLDVGGEAGQCRPALV